jgi:hypothetical protein
VLHDLHELLHTMGAMCSKSSSGARPVTRDGSGRGGAASFPVRGRQTWRDKARMSTGEVRGCFPPT